MNNITLKTALLAVPVVLVDAATFWNVFQVYDYFEHSLSALLVAGAFVALQAGALVLYAQELPAATRRSLLAGAGILLVVTGLSNVAIAGVRGSAAFPSNEVAAVMSFGADPPHVFVAAVWLTGLALVTVALIFWNAFAEHLASERHRSLAAQQELERILRGEKE